MSSASAEPSAETASAITPTAVAAPCPQPTSQPAVQLPVPAAPVEPDSWLDTSSDDRDEGWSERSAGHTDDWYLSERPPHHG